MSVCARPAHALGVQVRGFLQQGQRLAFGADVSLRFELGPRPSSGLSSASSTLAEQGDADEAVYPELAVELAGPARTARRVAEPATRASAAPERVTNAVEPASEPAPGEAGASERSGAAAGVSERSGAAAGVSERPGAGAKAASSERRPPVARRAAVPSRGIEEDRAAVEPRVTRRFVRRLLHEATRAQRHARGRTRQLSRQANVSAWLPRLQLRVGRYRDETLRLAPTIAEPDRWQLTGGADWRIDGQATWQLNRLVFTSEQMTLERLRAQAQRDVERRQLQVLELLFQWQRAAAALNSELLHPDERQAAWWTAQEAQLHLDVLSGGWFSRHAPRVEPAHWPLGQ